MVWLRKLFLPQCFAGLALGLTSGGASAEQIAPSSAKGDFQAAVVLGDVLGGVEVLGGTGWPLAPAIAVAPMAGAPAMPVVVPPAVERSPLAPGLSTSERVRRLLTRQDGSSLGGYDGSSFLEQSRAIPWDVALLLGGITYVGIKNWNWGSTEFHFNSEGWFDEDTGSMGMDKLGHAYTTYLFTEYLTQRILQEADDPGGAAFTAAALALGLQTYVEIFDGYSGDHGFSWEDMAANTAGAAFSVLRSTVPGLAGKVDFRMEYLPSGNAKVSPLSDYSGQKYLLALKLSGFSATAETPLEFVELQAGYYARGFTDEERQNNEERRRETYLGIGVNLSQVFARSDSVPGLMLERLFEYVQVPYTYAATSND